jgi:hypothetical protein
MAAARNFQFKPGHLHPTVAHPGAPGPTRVPPATIGLQIYRQSDIVAACRRSRSYRSARWRRRFFTSSSH